MPEPAFIAICSYLHPIDIVKNVSAVSRRWNWLVKKLHLCRQARINITDPPYHRYSLGVFLHEVRIALLSNNLKIIIFDSQIHTKFTNSFHFSREIGLKNYV